ncbi:MAG TPA: Gfo/Idh/MocA family oxidoreductase [Bryobacteraceae bacterium]|nr:Gfo/Idh/MocA family oxidoreductase [Bryobacteraceae bacterium]
MQTRRYFLGNVATGLAGSLATGRVLGANDRLRIGIVGVGERGTQLAREAAACPNTEIAAVADVYRRRLDDAKALGSNIRTYTGHEELLADKSIDAVLIATPQHLHAEAFTAALHHGKHVYVERAMAFTLDDAKRMRAAVQDCGTGRAVQVGHQFCSSGQAVDAINYLSSGSLGQVTAIRSHLYRNTPHGKPQWARPVFPDMTPDSIAWKSFLGSAADRDFDAHRFANWRYYSDYSGGSVQENLSQQLSFWYRVMDIGIPSAVTMRGGIYIWKDGREVPDTMTVSMEHINCPWGDLLFNWDSGFGNNHPGMNEEVLGTDGTIVRGQQIRFVPQKVNQPGAAELMGQTPTAPRAHMQNFLDSIRTGQQPNCPFEVGYKVSVACRMALESYRLGRTVTWDAEREEIV